MGGATKAKGGVIVALSGCVLITVVRQRGWEHVR